jgi:hypothetical protein
MVDPTKKLSASARLYAAIFADESTTHCLAGEIHCFDWGIVYKVTGEMAPLALVACTVNVSPS